MGFRILSFLILLGLASGGLAQPALLGTWVIDYENSDRDEVVWEFEELSSGLWQFRADGRNMLQFRMDDRDCATCTATERWRVVGENAWNTGWGGRGDASDIIRISADQRSLSIVSTGTRRDGSSIERARTFRRISGIQGLAGEWLLETEQSRSAPVIELGAGVGEWFVFQWRRGSTSADEVVCILLLDGAEHDCVTASFLAPGWTMAATRTGETTLEVELTRYGEIVFDSTFEVSGDGNSMLETKRTVTGASVRTAYNRK